MKKTLLLAVSIAGALSSTAEAAPLYTISPVFGDVDTSTRLISDDGKLITTTRIGGPGITRALVFDVINDTATSIGALGTRVYTNSFPSEISANGNWVTGESGLLDNHAFLWSPSTGIQALFEADGTLRSGGIAVDNSGRVLGYSVTQGIGPVHHASLWEDGKEYDLNSIIRGTFSDHLTFGVKFTDTGSLLARGNQGLYELKPVPVPGAIWLMGSALAGLAGIRRKAA